MFSHCCDPANHLSCHNAFLAITLPLSRSNRPPIQSLSLFWLLHYNLIMHPLNHNRFLASVLAISRSDKLPTWLYCVSHSYSCWLEIHPVNHPVTVYSLHQILFQDLTNCTLDHNVFLTSILTLSRSNELPMQHVPCSYSHQLIEPTTHQVTMYPWHQLWPFRDLANYTLDHNVFIVVALSVSWSSQATHSVTTHCL